MKGVGPITLGDGTVVHKVIFYGGHMDYAFIDANGKSCYESKCDNDWWIPCTPDICVRRGYIEIVKDELEIQKALGLISNAAEKVFELP